MSTTGQTTINRPLTISQKEQLRLPDSARLVRLTISFISFWWQLAAGGSLNCASRRSGWGECSRNATAIHSVAGDRSPNLLIERRTCYHWAITAPDLRFLGWSKHWKSASRTYTRTYNGNLLKGGIISFPTWWLHWNRRRANKTINIYSPQSRVVQFLGPVGGPHHQNAVGGVRADPVEL